MKQYSNLNFITNLMAHCASVIFFLSLMSIPLYFLIMAYKVAEENMKMYDSKNLENKLNNILKDSEFDNKIKNELKKLEEDNKNG